MANDPDPALGYGVIQTIEDLKEYALRALGKPVINIEVDDDQCYDRIHDAISKFVERHYDGSYETYQLHVVTADDISNGFVRLPNYWVSVSGITTGTLATSSGEPFESLDYLIANSEMVKDLFFSKTGFGSCKVGSTSIDSGSGGSFLNMYFFNQELDMIHEMFSSSNGFNFNTSTHRVDFVGGIPAEGDSMLIHGYMKFDPNEYGDIFSNEWIRKYSTALIGMQWGTNVFKYDGVQLPGGITLNGNAIYDRYSQIKDKLDDEFSDKYTLPPDFFIA